MKVTHGTPDHQFFEFIYFKLMIVHGFIHVRETPMCA